MFGGLRRPENRRMKGERSRRAVPEVGIQDVARLAKVSISTVSRVLNASAPVSPEIQGKVEMAVRALNYVPHGAARALASRRSQTVGAIVPTVDNAIFAKAIAAFQKRLSGAGYTLLLACSEYDLQREFLAAKALVERGVDALMLVGTVHERGLEPLLEGRGVPYVNTWALDSADRVPCVGFDNLQAVRKLVHFLMDLGHRQFAMLAGVTRDNDRAKARVDGLKQALTERGLEIGDAAILESAYGIAEARVQARRLLRLTPRPSVIVCGNDVLATGAIFECQAQGLTVPGDVSICGFDDLELSQHLSPGLTTMHVPSETIGELAADYLLGVLAGRPMPRSVELEVSLVVRGSTGPPTRSARARKRSDRG